MEPSKPQLPAIEPPYNPKFVNTFFLLLFFLLSSISYAKLDPPSVYPPYNPEFVNIFFLFPYFSPAYSMQYQISHPTNRPPCQIQFFTPLVSLSELKHLQTSPSNRSTFVQLPNPQRSWKVHRDLPNHDSSQWIHTTTQSCRCLRQRQYPVWLYY